MNEILMSRWSNVTDGWAWQVGISVIFENLLNIPRYKCMGILVDKEFVLTTGHCLKFGYIRINPSRIMLSLGSYMYGFRKAKINIKAKKIYFHPVLDLGLIQLNEELRFSKFVQPLCLPNAKHVDTAIGKKLVTSRWSPER